MTFFGKSALADIVAMFAILGVANTLFWAYMRTQYVPRAYLFCPKNGTPIYRSIEDCIKLEEKREAVRKEREQRLEKTIDNKIKEIKDSNDLFVKGLRDMFATQNRELADVIKNAVRPQGAS